jgi:hypothetical protein
MREDTDTHIWWGPIASERQAREIIHWAAGSLLLLGAAPAGALVLAAIQREISLAAPYYLNRADNWFVLGQALYVGVEMTAAALLLRTKSWMSALILLMCCAMVMTLLMATILRLSAEGPLDLVKAAEYLVLEVCLMFFAWLVWRAMTAARALARLRAAEEFA